MNFIDIASIFSAWFLGILTQNITNDSKAKALCRRNLLNLKNNLEELALQIDNPSRRPNDDLKKIKNIKTIIQEMEVCQAEFLFKIPGLIKLIDNSEALLEKAKRDCDNPANYPPFIAINLLQLWGEGTGKYYKSTKIEEFRSLVDFGFIKRMWYAIKRTLLSWNKIMKLIDHLKTLLPVDRLVIWNTIKKYGMVFSLLALLGIFSRYFFTIFKFTDRHFFGIILATTALLGRLGWKHQTCGGESCKEKCDKLFFWIFSIVSFFLLI